MAKRTVVITGGSSGIGAAAAKRFLAGGDYVYELSRHAGTLSGVRHIDTDVTSEASVAKAITKILTAERKIDVLVCCAGMGVSGPVELIPEADTCRQFDVNLLGTIRCVRAVLPAMRTQQSGKIICVSSVAAVHAIPFQAYYSASKAAINAFTDALGNEMRPFGVQVCAVMPGDIATGFTAARVKTENADAAYKNADSAVAKMEQDEKNGMPPEAVADLIFKLASRKKLAPLYTVGLTYKTLVFLKRLFPAALASRIVGGMYK